MRRSRSALPLAVLLVVGALLAGLTAADATPVPEKKILRVPWGNVMPEILEPQTNEFGIFDLTLLVYEGLTRIDEELTVVPGAAESWQFNDDGTMITFRLRENLSYSDGSPLTAERFLFAIERRCDPHLTWWGAQSLFDIAGCEALHTVFDGTAGTPAADRAAYEEAKANLGVRALDDRTLEIQLTKPAPYFPAIARWVGFIPVKQELIAAGGEEWWRNPANWIGNGPFRLTGIETAGTSQRVTLAPNARYWGGQPRLDGIEYVIMDAEDAMAAYTQGDLDVAYPNIEHLSALEADPDLSRDLLRMPSPTSSIFNFNLRREPFTDKRVREAFAYAFDRAAYCREMLRGSCSPLLSWIPPGIPGAIETTAYVFDPVKARQSLAASSYGGPEHLPEIVWYYGADDTWELEHARWLAAQFAQVLGVELTLTPLPWDELDAQFDSPETWPQMTNTYWWSSLPDPHEWMLYWTCGDPRFAASVGYCNPEYDARVARADRAMDLEERIRLAQESQHLLIADAPAIFGYAGDQFVLVKPYLTGYTRSAPYLSWPG